MSNEESKEKFLKALEKKKSASNPSGTPKVTKSKVQGEQSTGGTPKMFRRKSGSN